MKYFISLFTFICLSFCAYGLELKVNEEYISSVDQDGCVDFILVRSENPSTPAWLLGPKIVFFDPGFKSTEKSNCMISKETIKKDKAWIQTTKSYECEDRELSYLRVEKLEQNPNGELIYSSEISYNDQRSQVQKLSCRFKKKTSKNN